MSAADDDTPRELDQSGLMHLVGYAATRASVQLKKTFSKHLGPLELKAVEFSILTLVADNREVNQKQLCQALDVSPPNLAVMLDRLAARGLVERVRGTVDRRAQIIHLTNAGRELQQRARKLASSMEDDAVRVLSNAERALLIELLHRVARGKPAKR